MIVNVILGTGACAPQKDERGIVKMCKRTFAKFGICLINLLIFASAAYSQTSRISTFSTFSIYPSADTVIARRDFRSLVTDIVVRDDTAIFVGANHDGLYAVDGKQADLPVLAYLPMPDHDHWANDIEVVSPDTLWLSDLSGLRKLYFTGNAFEELASYFDGRRIAGGTCVIHCLLCACAEHPYLTKTCGALQYFIRLFSSHRCFQRSEVLVFKGRAIC